MKKIILMLAIMIGALGVTANAQATHKTIDKFEFNVEANYLRRNANKSDVTTIPKRDETRDLIGGTVGGSYYFNNKNLGFTCEGSVSKRSNHRTSYVGCGGIAKKRSGFFRPFAVATVGGSSEVPADRQFTGVGIVHPDQGVAATVGAGVDVKLKGRVNLRLFRADYMLTRVGQGGDIEPRHNIRLGAGIVF